MFAVTNRHQHHCGGRGAVHAQRMILPLGLSGIALVRNSSRSSHAPSPARRFVSMSMSTVKPFSSAQRRASTVEGP